MKINHNEIKAGDRVQIANGDWFEIIGEGDPEPGACNVWAWFDVGGYQIPSYLITDHQPAQQPHGNLKCNPYEALGWMHGECCRLLEEGKDPRTIEVPVLVSKAEAELEKAREA